MVILQCIQFLVVTNELNQVLELVNMNNNTKQHGTIRIYHLYLFKAPPPPPPPHTHTFIIPNGKLITGNEEIRNTTWQF